MSNCEHHNKCYCTAIKCCLTGCYYNSACCVNPSNTDTYCTLKQIDLKLDEETGVIDCCQYQYDYEKPYECMECQIEKHGEIELESDIEFVEVENIEDLFK